MPIYAEKNMRYVHFAEICENVAVMYSEMSGDGKKLVWQWAGMDVKGTNGDWNPIPMQTAISNSTAQTLMMRCSVRVRVTPHSKKTSVVQCQHADEVGVSADGRTVGTSRHTLNTGAASLPCELGGESLYCASEWTPWHRPDSGTACRSCDSGCVGPSCLTGGTACRKRNTQTVSPRNDFADAPPA